MAQDYTTDPYNSAHVVATDMGEINNNFAALKSAFSGATTPANTVAGQWWYDTTAHILKVRNEANTAWLSVWDLANNKPVITNLSAEITGAMIAAAIKDAAAGTASLRTLGTGAAQACAGNDSRLSDTRTPTDNTVATAKIQNLAVIEGKLAASAVAQAKLKTSTGSVSVSVSTESSGYTAAMPGGTYGFMEQVKTSGVGGLKYSGHGNSGLTTSYVTAKAYFENPGTGSSYTGYAQQVYVTSSGEIHWIFILRDKITKDILKMYQAPDHPCFGNGGKPHLMPQPFTGDYDPAKHEIIVINPSDEDVFNMQDACIMPEDKPDKDILEVIMEDYEIDEDLKTPWTKKEVTVGLPPGIDWKRMPEGSKVTPIKKRIPKPEYITTRKLWRRK
ncbi:MAG: hypothetical protein WC372_08950 [Candidatus Neomarinimicrobiota bacterium]|jgi:hypothetical protein